jgi:hypothetical protein
MPHRHSSRPRLWITSRSEFYQQLNETMQSLFHKGFFLSRTKTVFSVNVTYLLLLNLFGFALEILLPHLLHRLLARAGQERHRQRLRRGQEGFRTHRRKM